MRLLIIGGVQGLHVYRLLDTISDGTRQGTSSSSSPYSTFVLS